MGLRFIPYYEVDENSPDSSYLAAGFRENLVEGMKGWSALNCGHTSYNLGTFYDVNSIILLSGAIVGSVALERCAIYVPNNDIDSVQIAVSGFHDQPVNPQYVWSFQLWDYAATTYTFYTASAPSTTTGVVSVIGTGIPGGAYYRLRVIAYRCSTAGPAVVFTLPGVRLRLYLV